MTIALSAQARATTGKKVKGLRENGVIPAVIYGGSHKGEPIEVSNSEFLKVFKQAGETQVIELDIDGKKVPVLVHDFELDPVKDTFMHVDFYEIDMSKPVTTVVPVHVIGVSPAVKNNKGLLVTNFRELEVTALPVNIPKYFEVDISRLEQVHDEITIADMNIGSDIEVEHDKELAVVTVTPLRTQASLEELDEEVTEDVEGVEGVKKEEKGEESDGESDSDAKEDKNET